MNIATVPETNVICPACSHEISVVKGYVTWCEKCNWNLQAPEPYQPVNIFERIYLKAGEKSNKQILDSLLQKEGSQTVKFSYLKLFTLLAASLVHIASLVFFIFGCFLIQNDFPNILFIILGISLVVLAWFTFPRLERLRQKPLPRESFPHLYKLADELSDVLHADKIHGIFIDEKYNASFSQVGWKQRKILYLGLPLLTVINKEETVALFSHEIAHGVNGDLNRNLWFGSAVRTLSWWYDITQPDRSGKSSIFTIIVDLLLYVLSKIIYLFLYILGHLNWRDAQRAEYLADQLAATAAGKHAVQSLLDKLHLYKTFEFTILKAMNTQREGQLFADLAEQFTSIPAKELERIQRIARLEHARLDGTHPPTSFRINYIDALADEAPAYTMSDDTYASVKSELSVLHRGVEKRIMDRYKRAYKQ
ncbi:M48 family metallopeptidase [Paenibacillus aestuarii]|uniref:M48 family metallopeptidase n=1 Tax=Paenibacillus aestuarii TaxID=516965 RepID=A0ABW0K737_9BACL|nr:M48 family metallopeptidase [Paenibacillus aestuarii]